MAKPGDVVEFKSGLHGIDAPSNLAILVKRYRVKGTPWVSVVTVKGNRDLKADHLTKRAFRDRYHGDLNDEQDAMARLRHLLAQHQSGSLAEEAEDDLGALEAALWDTATDARPPRADPSEQAAPGQEWREEDLAHEHYGSEPSRQQMRDIHDALARCRRPGVGRFEQGTKGDRWVPWTAHQVDLMRDAWNRLGSLRRDLIVAEEDADGQRVFRRLSPDDASMAAHRETLAWVRDAMQQWVEWDGVPDGQPVAGIGGLGAVAAFGMDLHRQLGFLAADWIRGAPTNRSSDYVQFLLEIGAWSAEDAVASLTKRHVNQEAFFEHVADGDAEAAAEALPEPSVEGEPDRVDMRTHACFTIDPPDARDFDDAVGLEARPDGRPGHRVWVHIADVSHYVQQDTLLDRHAKKRATSVYLPGRVLPMLPARISDHLCSLRDDGDRYALSVALDVDPDGTITAGAFQKSLIRVAENLTYDVALARAKAGDQPFAGLLAVANAIRQQRRGLNLDTGETRISLQTDGFNVVEKRATEATQLIETLMVAANEAVAAHLDGQEVPVLFRCHDLPATDRAQRLAHQLPVLGLDVNLDLSKAPLPDGMGAGATDPGAGSADDLLEQLRSGGGKMQLFGGGLGFKASAPAAESEPEVPSPKAAIDPRQPTGFAALDATGQDAWLAPFRNAIDAIAKHQDRNRAEVATLKVLQAMPRAYYAPGNAGHFGLGLTYYCHFTSPIRRYPDLVVHRNLKWLIEGRPTPEPPHTFERLEALCDHCSDQERAAADLERTVRGGCLVLASLYDLDAPAAGVQPESVTPSSSEANLSEAVDHPSAARVTGITPAGLWVRLANGLEARVPARDLPGGPYDVDEWEAFLFLRPGDAAARFTTDELAAGSHHQDPDDPEPMWVRCRLGDGVTVHLTGRDVAAGRTGAVVRQW